VGIHVLAGSQGQGGSPITLWHLHVLLVVLPGQHTY
jgi:hypothetical protein